MTPDTPVMDAFEAMQSNGIGRLLVVDSADPDRLVGLLTRTDVMTALEIMREGGEVTAERGRSTAAE
jgi:predicted transcriptional regulator